MDKSDKILLITIVFCAALAIFNVLYQHNKKEKDKTYMKGKVKNIFFSVSATTAPERMTTIIFSDGRKVTFKGQLFKKIKPGDYVQIEYNRYYGRIKDVIICNEEDEQK